ncbi:hypothetical protein [Sabulicella rubraurantiaca]|uniref:hypothetical protein n=1 Tax=Sabulicella rubraurantiaca TaxID=2811429 RepID=UPI001A966BF4|nr:hypothetical protein [Sabulicella rubraurantiaca]
MALLAARIHPALPMLGGEARMLGHVSRQERRHMKLTRDSAGRHHLWPLSAAATMDGTRPTLLMPPAEAPLLEA